MPKQIDSSPKIRRAEVPRLRTGDDAFMRKAERKPLLSLKAKGSQVQKGLQKYLKGALGCATYDRGSGKMQEVGHYLHSEGANGQESIKQYSFQKKPSRAI